MFVEDVLAARPAPSLRAVTERATRAEIDAAWPGTPRAPGEHAAEIELVRPVERLVEGVRQTVDVRVRNSGACRWPLESRSRSGRGGSERVRE